MDKVENSHTWINPERFNNLGKDIFVDGVKLHVQLSSYDTPTKVSGVYDPRLKRFRIVFDYIDDEPLGKTDTVKKIEFVSGKHSGKLLEIRIPIDNKPLDKIGLIQLQTNVSEALGTTSENYKNSENDDVPYGRILNYEAALNVLTNESDFQQVSKSLAVAE